MALRALGGRHSNPRFLYSRLCHRCRIDFLTCFGGHQSIGPFSYHLEAVASRSHKVLLSFVKKRRQEIYGKSEWPLTGFFTIWEGPPAGNNRTLRSTRNGTATSEAHWVVSISSIWTVTSLHASVGPTEASDERMKAQRSGAHETKSPPKRFTSHLVQSRTPAWPTDQFRPSSVAKKSAQTSIMP